MPVVSGFFILYGVIASYPELHHIISVEQHQRNTEGGSNDKESSDIMSPLRPDLGRK